MTPVLLCASGPSGPGIIPCTVCDHETLISSGSGAAKGHGSAREPRFVVGGPGRHRADRDELFQGVPRGGLGLDYHAVALQADADRGASGKVQLVKERARHRHHDEATDLSKVRDRHRFLQLYESITVAVIIGRYSGAMNVRTTIIYNIGQTPRLYIDLPRKAIAGGSWCATT